MGKPNNQKDGGIGGTLKNSLSKLTGKVTLKAPSAKEQPKVQASRPVKPATPKPMAPPKAAGSQQPVRQQPTPQPASAEAKPKDAPKQAAPKQAAAKPAATKPAAEAKPKATAAKPAAAKAASPAATPQMRASDSALANVISNDVTIEGELKFSDALVFDGRLKGQIISDGGALTIQPNALVEASVAVKTLIIAGKVVGNITATESVHLAANAVVIGDITTGSLTMEPNASFQGQGRIGQPTIEADAKKTADVASMPKQVSSKAA